jgi:hypothetical protein
MPQPGPPEITRHILHGSPTEGYPVFGHLGDDRVLVEYAERCDGDAVIRDHAAENFCVATRS